MMFDRHYRKRPRVEMIPMIDVIFFLLVFFMLFTTFKTKDAGLNIDLPKSVTSQQHDITQLEITINQSGSIFYDGKLVSESMLKESIIPILEDSPQMPVIITADRRANYEFVYDTMDLITQAGGSKIFLNAKAELQ